MTAARRPGTVRRSMLASTPVGSVVVAAQAGLRRNTRFAEAELRDARLQTVIIEAAASLFGDATVSPCIGRPT